MANTVTLHKILHVREMEKNNAQKEYHQSVDAFEKVATELYVLLKKKENMEASYEASIQTSTSIERIKEQAAYIEMLNSEISKLQQQVQIARNNMEKKQLKLTDAHVEVKKFQKIIEIREEERKEQEKRIETAFMDEISVYQFLSQKNR